MVARNLTFESDSEFDKNYKPTMSEAVGAYVDSAMYGEGTAEYNIKALQDPIGEPFTEEQYKTSGFYRDEMKFEPGYAQNQWENRAAEFDAKKQRDFILSKTSTAQDVVGFISALAVGILEPQNVVTGAVLGAGFGALVRSSARGIRLYESASVLKKAGLGVAEGAVSAAATEPLNLYGADKGGSEYDLADSAWNVLTSSLFGAAMTGGGQAYKNHMASRDASIRVKELVVEAARDGKALPVEQASAVASLEEKVSLTNERDTYVKQRDELVNNLSQAEQANVRLYDEMYDIENNKAMYAYGIDDPQIVNALEVVRTQQKAAPDKSLFKFLKSKGGVRSEGGEFKAMGISGRTMPGMVNNKTGMTLDDAAIAAHEAGLIGNPDSKELPDLMDEVNRGLHKTTGNDASVNAAEQFLADEGISATEYIAKYNKAAPELDKRVNEIKSTITSPDITARLRSSINEVDGILNDFPPDEVLLLQAKEAVRKMLSEEEPEPYNQFLSQEDVARLGDEQKQLLDQVDEYQESGQLDELDIAEAENAIEIQRAALNAGHLCLTGS